MYACIGCRIRHANSIAETDMKTSTRASTLLVAALIASLYPCAVCATPIPTVAMAAGQKSPSNVVPLRFSAVFSEPVTGFTAEDVILSRDAMVAVAEQVPYAGTTFEIKITAAPDDGPLCLSIPGGAAMGLDGSPSLPSAGTETCIVLDRDPPRRHPPCSNLSTVLQRRIYRLASRGPPLRTPRGSPSTRSRSAAPRRATT